MNIDVGKLTAEECALLLADLIDAMTEELLFSVLAKELTKEQKEELVEVLTLSVTEGTP